MYTHTWGRRDIHRERLIDFLHHSTLGLRVITKKNQMNLPREASGTLEDAGARNQAVERTRHI